MAEQKSFIKLKGTIGDISFYKTKTGYQAREKGGVDKNRIASDPRFQRTRENGAEFGRAGKAGKLIRTAFKSVIGSGKDSGMSSRLTRDLVKVVQADALNDRGERNVMDGEIELLTGFEFNENGKISTTISVEYAKSIDRATGEFSVTFPAFSPGKEIVKPSGASHFKLQCASALIDFEAGTHEVAVSESALLALDNKPLSSIALSNNLTAGSSKPLFLALGIEFYQQVNGKEYLLSNGTFNGLCLVAIDG